ncbi:hypothetical protein DPMN_061897 [Dreissena polymorpha]|uniref:Uncharacterized protein n=1 Tax=Dreissena polymorpha TaxID=45954 RepID=A0A9D4C8Q6_DREPO|nr:hypothetical protein DPMN_061897 [Dreissena polymorpha]
MKKLTQCPKHPYIDLDQYCPTHDVSICPFCLKSDHRLCENLTDIISLFQGGCPSENCSELIKVFFNRCNLLQTETMKIANDVHTNNFEVAQDIQLYILTLNDAIEQLERRLSEKHECLISPVNEAIKCAEQMVLSVEKKAIYYDSLFEITTKYGTLKHNIVLQFMTCSLLKALGEHD